jgi:hypothetical protein
LQLPGSVLLQYEELVPFPNITFCSENLGLNERVMMSYLGQLWLRKSCLNAVHKSFYNPNEPSPADTYPPGPQALQKVAEFERLLDPKTSLPTGFKFERDDAPSEDILAARLRAKWWGANVIIYRPFVKQVLDINQRRLSGGVTAEQIEADTSIHPQVLDWASKGIHALKESTKAFHAHSKVHKRFIITNVFGTAHA